MQGKKLNFAPSVERSSRRPPRADEESEAAEHAKSAARSKTDKTDKTDRTDDVMRPWARTTGLPMDVWRWAPSHRNCVRALQVVVLAALVVQTMLEVGLEHSESRVRPVDVQDFLRRCAVVLLSAVVDVSAVLPFHACVVALMAQIGEPSATSQVTVGTLGAAVAVTMHRCALHPLRMWLMLLVVVAAGSAMLSLLVLALMLPQHVWLSEIMLLGLSAAVYAVVHISHDKGG